MATSDVSVATIGAALRAAREARRLTLEQAAELAGLSKSHLSRLESGERQPSVASILSLSRALGMPVGSLFGESEGAAAILVSPPDEPRHQSNGLVIGTCSGYTGSGVIDALRITVQPDRPDTPPVRHLGEEWLYVLRGTLRLDYDGDTHLLDEGTAAHFNAELPHRLGADERPTEILLVAAKPSRTIHTIH